MSLLLLLALIPPFLLCSLLFAFFSSCCFLSYSITSSLISASPSTCPCILFLLAFGASWDGYRCFARKCLSSIRKRVSITVVEALLSSHRTVRNVAILYRGMATGLSGNRPLVWKPALMCSGQMDFAHSWLRSDGKAAWVS